MNQPNNRPSAPGIDVDLSHSMVHYLLTIHKLKEEKGYSRVTDIARELNITKGSVSTAINNLKKRDLVVEDEDSKFLSLSETGHAEVHRILTSRTLIFYFLKDFLGVDEKIAERDSCLMEHLMSEETQVKFFDFMKTLACACKGKDINQLDDFKFETTFDLCQFENAEEFMGSQKGDTHLE